jgi:hypothetical protein
LAGNRRSEQHQTNAATSERYNSPERIDKSPILARRFMFRVDVAQCNHVQPRNSRVEHSISFQQGNPSQKQSSPTKTPEASESCNKWNSLLPMPAYVR